MRAGFPPCAIVLGRKGAPGSRRVRRLAADTPLLETPDWGDPGHVRSIELARPDVLLSWFYPKRIPERLLALASRGAFGTHPSLLPRWRGPDPYFWALYSGDRESGVTLHRLERDYDTGALVQQVRVALDPKEHAWALARRLDRPALRLLVDCAEWLRAGETLTGTAQDEAAVTLAPAPPEELLAIDWKQSAEQIERLVRAAAPYPGASAELGEELVEVLRVEPYPAELPRALAPADAVSSPLGLVVRAGDRGLLIREVRLESGELLRDHALLELFPGGIARVGITRT
jgi:methionyl-tRNA formyltransferase